MVRENGPVYATWVALSYFCDGANFSCFPALSAKMFGAKNGATIFTICFIAVPLSSTLSLILVDLKSVIPEVAIFYVGAALTGVNMILIYFFDESTYSLKDDSIKKDPIE